MQQTDSLLQLEGGTELQERTATLRKQLEDQGGIMSASMRTQVRTWFGLVKGGVTHV